MVNELTRQKQVVLVNPTGRARGKCAGWVMSAHPSLIMGWSAVLKIGVQKTPHLTLALALKILSSTLSEIMWAGAPVQPRESKNPGSL